MTIKTFVLAGVAGAAVLAAMPFSSHPVLAQNNTYVAPDEGQSGDDQSSQEMKKQRRQGQSSDDQSSQDMKKRRQGQSSDDQSTREMKKQRMDGQQDDEQASREMRREGKREGKVVWDRDRHGQRMRQREGRFRYLHEGYYYATPWWTTGVVVDGGVGIGCREGARIVSRRGFNRVAPVDCGGEFFTYRGWRGGEPWRVRVDYYTGRIVSNRPSG